MQEPIIEKRAISTLRPWDKNPRGIMEEDFNRLKEQIKRLGLYKPILITNDGEIIGGNMRYRAIMSLREEGATNMDEVVVSVVNPTNETEKLEYALSDNDRAGYYEDDKLYELLADSDLKLNNLLNLYKVDLGGSVSIEKVLSTFGPASVERTTDSDNTDDKLQTYLEGAIRQIVLYFTVDQYQDVVSRLEAIREKHHLEDNTAAFLLLLDHYDEDA